MRFRFLFVIFVSLFLIPFGLGAQSGDAGTMYVKEKYPQLYEIFGKDMTNLHATYTFAIDVSGTMKKYADIVIPAMTDFIKALPDGDYVRIIRFGRDSKDNDNGYLGTISDDMKSALESSVRILYANPNDDHDFYGLTNIPAMMKSVAGSLEKSVNEMNFVFVMTDFRNEEPGKPEGKINKSDLENIRTSMQASSIGKSGRIVTLLLPTNPSWKGFCLGQLEDEVYPGLDLSYEKQIITNDAALKAWFTDLKTEIMISRLRTLVESENKVAKISMKTDVDIDGNTHASIKWAPNRLYKAVKVSESFVTDSDADSSVISARKDGTSSGFTFANDKKAFRTTEETDLNLRLGRIKNEKIFFHHFDGNLNLGIDLPTSFDDELMRLQVKKPIPEVSNTVDRWIFTFPLSFCLTVILLSLLLLYFILVIRAAGKINSTRLTVDVQILGYPGNKDLTLDGLVTRKKEFTIPGNHISYSGPQGEWQIMVFREKMNPFTHFINPKPRFKVKLTSGVARIGEDELGRNGKRLRMPCEILCGASLERPTHCVIIAKN